MAAQCTVKFDNTMKFNREQCGAILYRAKYCSVSKLGYSVVGEGYSAVQYIALKFNKHRGGHHEWLDLANLS